LRFFEVYGKDAKDSIKRKQSVPKSIEVSLIAILSATAISIAFVRSWAPNIEATSLITFTSGYVLGTRIGGLIGAFTEGVSSLFNPLGPAPMPIFVGQVGCMMLIGAVGGVIGRFSDRTETNSLNKSLMMGAAGLYLTIIYDLVTNLGFALSFGTSYEIALIAGLAFMIIHVSTNTLFFGAVGPVLSRYMLKTIEAEGAYRD
jgi:hypothetical protein